jgi:hypothetical protein
MKKLIFGIIAVFTLLTLFTGNASAQKEVNGTKYATVVTGYIEGQYVENKLPFGIDIVDPNFFKKDERATVYWATVKVQPGSSIPGEYKAVVAIFRSGAFKDSLENISAHEDSVIVLDVSLIDPLTDWSGDLKKDWEEYLKAEGFEAFKAYKIGWVSNFHLEPKSEVIGKENLVDLGANAELIKAGKGPNGETNGRWTFSPFGGWSWTANK